MRDGDEPRPWNRPCIAQSKPCLPNTRREVVVRGHKTPKGRGRGDGLRHDALVGLHHGGTALVSSVPVAPCSSSSLQCTQANPEDPCPHASKTKRHDHGRAWRYSTHPTWPIFLEMGDLRFVPRGQNSHQAKALHSQQELKKWLCHGRLDGHSKCYFVSSSSKRVRTEAEPDLGTMKPDWSGP